jgi:hypothetical protein
MTRQPSRARTCVYAKRNLRQATLAGRALGADARSSLHGVTVFTSFFGVRWPKSFTGGVKVATGGCGRGGFLAGGTGRGFDNIPPTGLPGGIRLLGTPNNPYPRLWQEAPR